MKKTQKLKTLVLAELDGLKQFIPIEVRKAKLVWEKYDPSEEEFCIYGLLASNSFGQIATWYKNVVTTPYSYVVEEYVRCRAKKFNYSNLSKDEQMELNICSFSPLEFYVYNLEKENKTHAQVFAYLLEETNKISL